MDDVVPALGMWSSRAYFLLGVAYVVSIGSGFLSNRNLKDPVKDPHLAIAEVLILVMAPVMVTMSVAIHASAAPNERPYTLIALGWMVAAAATTSIVHFVELTVGRQLGPGNLPAHEQIFGFRWPSILYAVDIVAWDIFFALALLFTAPAFDGETAIQAGILASGLLALIGLVGPVTGRIPWRGIGIFGYAVVFPATCLPLSHYFESRS